MNKRNTQCTRLLDYLKDHKEGITQLEALNQLGIMRLTSRICELKEDGYLFKKEMITVLNRFNEKCSIARYTLLGRVGE